MLTFAFLYWPADMDVNAMVGRAWYTMHVHPARHVAERMWVIQKRDDDIMTTKKIRRRQKTET